MEENHPPRQGNRAVEWITGLRSIIVRAFPWRAKAPPDCSVPDGLRIYAVGDIHGMASILDRTHDAIRADHEATADGRRPVIVYLGDYIDRGPDSRRVLDILAQQDAPITGVERRFLMGNHEQALMGFLKDPITNADWLEFGGLETLESYRIKIRHDLGRRERLEHMAEALRESLPPPHLTFLERLEPMVEYGDYLFVHAGVDPALPLDRQGLDELLWIRKPFLESPRWLGKRIVHGHTVTDVPDIRPNRIGIDTGAYLTGRLTTLVLAGTTMRILAP